MAAVNELVQTAWLGSEVLCLSKQQQTTLDCSPPDPINEAVDELVDQVVEKAAEKVVDESVQTDVTFPPARLDSSTVAGSAADVLVLPLEQVLLRSVHLPLKSVGLIDADILSQELADRAGIEPDEWWLSWDMAVVEDGVAGIVVGIPRSWCDEISTHPFWQVLTHASVDASVRLEALRNVSFHSAEAIVDEDESGLFVGYFDGQTWRGIRRINRPVHEGSSLDSMLDEAWMSLEAMGFEASSGVLHGQLSQQSQAYFEQRATALGFAIEIKLLETLPDRLQANLDAWDEKLPVLNLRHGSWKAGPGWQKVKPWRRTFALALAGVVLWSAMTWSDIASMQSEQEVYQQRMIDSFHQALPDQPIVDALAQLQQAVSGGTQGDAMLLLTQLQGISQAFKQTPWQVTDLIFRNQEMVMTGQSKDLTSVNHLRNLVEQQVGHSVSVVDTDLADQFVKFRMKWSCKTL